MAVKHSIYAQELLHMAESELCHIVNAIHLPFFQRSFQGSNLQAP